MQLCKENCALDQSDELFGYNYAYFILKNYNQAESFIIYNIHEIGGGQKFSRKSYD